MMYLCIYKKGKKLYFATVKKLTDKIGITNPEFKTVVLGYKNKIQSYVLNDVEDLCRILPELRDKYACNIYVLENRYSDKTQIKMVVFLLNNPFWEVALFQRDEKNNVDEGKCATRTIQIENLKDWEQAKQEFDFESDFIYSLIKEN